MGCFSPFPHGTGSLSVRNEYLALRDGPRGFKQGFSCPALLRYPLRVQINFAYAPVTLFGTAFQRSSAIDWIGNSTVAGPTTPVPPKWNGFGLFRVRSPLLSESRFLSLPRGTEMVHFPPFACSSLCIQLDIPGFCPGGFPHSEISGSTPVCGSPKLIAACHVLHRLFLPRHPPCALSSLLIEFTRTQHLPAPSVHVYALIILKTLNTKSSAP